MMEQEIIEHSDNAGALEHIYRSNPKAFQQALPNLLDRFKDQKLAEFWQVRLADKEVTGSSIIWGNTYDIALIIVFSIIAGILVNLPEFTSLKYDAYLQQNSIFLFAPFIGIYLLYKNKASSQQILVSVGLILLALIYSNTLHYWNQGQDLFLGYLFIPLFVWFIVGWIYCEGQWNDLKSRLYYLSFNGSLAVVIAIILAAGAILMALTHSLFSFINKSTSDFIISYLAPGGLAATPIVGAYILLNNDGIVDRISPMVAKIFSHLAIIVLVAFLIVSLTQNLNPFYDRHFLLVINFVFIAVIALCLFLVTEISTGDHTRYNLFLILILSSLTVIIGLIALSSIIFRISQWGITANRTAVLGSNILLFVHTCLILYDSTKIIKGKASTERINNQIAQYLTCYFGWICIVAFIFPLIF
ncbi:MAG TPA: hypothetical protein VKA34_12945 [Balneolales bacterium]|nr:hypothetical protein [Balneolales bacterium]